MNEEIEDLKDRNKELWETLYALKVPLREAADNGELPRWTNFEILAKIVEDALSQDAAIS